MILSLPVVVTWTTFSPIAGRSRSRDRDGELRVLVGGS